MPASGFPWIVYCLGGCAQRSLVVSGVIRLRMRVCWLVTIGCHFPDYSIFHSEQQSSLAQRAYKVRLIVRILHLF